MQCWSGSLLRHRSIGLYHLELTEISGCTTRCQNPRCCVTALADSNGPSIQPSLTSDKVWSQHSWSTSRLPDDRHLPRTWCLNHTCCRFKWSAGLWAGWNPAGNSLECTPRPVKGHPWAISSIIPTSGHSYFSDKCFHKAMRFPRKIFFGVAGQGIQEGRIVCFHRL